MARFLAATRTALRNDALRVAWAAQGSTLEGIDPAEFERLLASESERWGALIRSIGLRLE